MTKRPKQLTVRSTVQPDVCPFGTRNYHFIQIMIPFTRVYSRRELVLQYVAGGVGVAGTGGWGVFRVYLWTECKYENNYFKTSRRWETPLDALRPATPSLIHIHPTGSFYSVRRYRRHESGPCFPTIFPGIPPPAPTYRVTVGMSV